MTNSLHHYYLFWEPPIFEHPNWEGERGRQGNLKKGIFYSFHANILDNLSFLLTARRENPLSCLLRIGSKQQGYTRRKSFTASSVTVLYFDRVSTVFLCFYLARPKAFLESLPDLRFIAVSCCAIDVAITHTEGVFHRFFHL